MMRVPAKSEAHKALLSLGSQCMAPIEKQRAGALWSKGKLDDASDEVCHNVSVVQRYINSLEKRLAARDGEPHTEVEEITPEAVQSACACHKD